MRLDHFGRRLITVPWTKAEAIPLALDYSDIGFWEGLGKLLQADIPLARNIGIRANYVHETFLKEPLKESMFEVELFAHEYTFRSIGSSRHLEKGRYQWKGTGRNQLALMSDFTHSWGGMSLEEGKDEFNFSQLLGPQYAVPVKGIFQYTDRSNGSDCFLIRDMSLPRLATVPIKGSNDTTMKNCRHLLENFFKTEGRDIWLKFTKQIIDTHKMGFVSRSPTTANFDIAGRVIDLYGSTFLKGEDLEIVSYQNDRFENPLAPVYWIVENYFSQLYSKMLGDSSESLMAIFNDMTHAEFKVNGIRFPVKSDVARFLPDAFTEFSPWIVIGKNLPEDMSKLSEAFPKFRQPDSEVISMLGEIK